MSAATGAGPRVVAFGGGHGLAASLRALRSVTSRVTAVVTVADDGGSSGRLRREFPHQLPPGDLRKALLALADDSTWAAAFGHRFGGSGALAEHAVGNLVLAGLTDVLGDPVAALSTAAELLGVRGRVLPMAAVPVDIVAEVGGLDPADASRVRTVRGQHEVATTEGRVVDVRLDPAEPPACGPALEAIAEADWLLFGPGSWFTSVLPHLLVPDLLKAVIAAPAKRCVVLNIAAQAGETSDFTPETHLEVFAAHAPGLSVDVVLANRVTSPDRAAVADAARTLGADVVFADVAVDDGSPRHDPDRLAAVYGRIFDEGGRSAWR